MRLTTKLLIVGLLAGSALSAGAQQRAPESPGMRNVSYLAADGTTLRGYLAVPDGEGPFPAVVMIHEWWGLNHDTTLLADALAEEGFVVLAADAFRGSVAQTVAEARRQVGSTPREQIFSDLDAAFAFLADHQAVQPDRIASLGFCFGGTHSMYMGTRNPDLAAVVIFYGGGPIQSAGELGVMAGPVLGIYGREDGSIPLAQVEGFRAALAERDVTHEVTVYPGVGHAFVKSGTYGTPGMARAAWLQAVSFLQREMLAGAM